MRNVFRVTPRFFCTQFTVYFTTSHPCNYNSTTLPLRQGKSFFKELINHKIIPKNKNSWATPDLKTSPAKSNLLLHCRKLLLNAVNGISGHASVLRSLLDRFRILHRPTLLVALLFSDFNPLPLLTL